MASSARLGAGGVAALLAAAPLLADGAVVPDFTAPAGQLAFDPNGTTFAAANSYASYLAYTASSGGHLNAVGECTVKNNFTP